MSQGPNDVNFGFSDPNIKKIAFFEVFSKFFVWVKDVMLDYHSINFQENPMKNGLLAAKNVKIPFFALWG